MATPSVNYSQEWSGRGATPAGAATFGPPPSFPSSWLPTFAPIQNDTSKVVYEHDLSTYPGSSPTYTKGKMVLGRGAYGTVYDAVLTNSDGAKDIAVKCSPVQANGIPNLFEACIMKSLHHPFLNEAHSVTANDRELNIFQPRAVEDLATHTRHRTANIPLATIRGWLFGISQAVGALHGANIIHADIKAANVLWYSDNSVRLADFTLSVKKWHPNMTFTKAACTCTHRPLECMQDRSWNEKLDIWSLGCTFYEIAYGHLLFPNQNIVLPIEDNNVVQLAKNDSDTRTIVNERCINAIIYWNASMFGIINPYKERLYLQPNLELIAPVTPLNTLIKRMLKPWADERPSINSVLGDPYFSGMLTGRAQLYRNEPNVSDQAELQRVDSYLTGYVTGPDSVMVRLLARNIYIRSANIRCHQDLKIVVCTHIARKLMVGHNVTLSCSPYGDHQIFPLERSICHNLHFRLLALNDAFPEIQ